MFDLQYNNQSGFLDVRYRKRPGLKMSFTTAHRSKGLLYCICAEFDKSADYQDRTNEKADLLQRIFAFVESNYNKDCSLDALAAHTSYHSAYLSRHFKQCTGLTFTDHVNRHRINEAAYMLRNSQRKILDVAYDCGFKSLRSFNRNFKAIMGMTPRDYRNTK